MSPRTNCRMSSWVLASDCRVGVGSGHFLADTLDFSLSACTSCLCIGRETSRLVLFALTDELVGKAVDVVAEVLTKVLQED